MSYLTYPCSDCGERIEETDSPVVIRVSVGTAELPGKPSADPRGLALPLVAWEALQQTKPSEQDMCVACYAWAHQMPLLNHRGEVVCDPRDFSSAEEFDAASRAAVAELRAQLPDTSPVLPQK